MADDIYLSPEEQDERARKWLKDNGPALAIGIGLGLAGIFGWNQYQASKIEAAEAASKLFNSAIEEVADSELASIDEQVDSLKADYAASSYTAKAVLLKAKQLSQTDLDAAATELQWVTDNAQESGLQHTARIRKAKILLAQDKLDEAKQLASVQPVFGFESNYQEILGDIARKQGDFLAARAHYDQAIDAMSGAQSGYANVISLKRDRLPVPTISEPAVPEEVDDSSDAAAEPVESDSDSE